MDDGSAFNVFSLSKYSSSSDTKSPNDSGSRSSDLLATPEDPPIRRRFRLKLVCKVIDVEIQHKEQMRMICLEEEEQK